MYPAGTNVSDVGTIVPQWIADCKNIENGQGSAAANISGRIDKKHTAIYQRYHTKIKRAGVILLSPVNTKGSERQFSLREAL